MNPETYRYLFTVRMRFDSDPNIDCFYKLVSPSGMSKDEVKMMTILKPDWKSKTINADITVLSGMDLRLRANSDMYQHVCMVRSTVELTVEDLENYVLMKYKDGELREFLKESTI